MEGNGFTGHPGPEVEEEAITINAIVALVVDVIWTQFCLSL